MSLVSATSQQRLIESWNFFSSIWLRTGTNVFSDVIHNFLMDWAFALPSGCYSGGGLTLAQNAAGVEIRHTRRQSVLAAHTISGRQILERHEFCFATLRFRSVARTARHRRRGPC